MLRSKPFRKWIASLPCLECGEVNHSQAAHFERGGRGFKGEDGSCRPLCADRPGIKGCHAKFDQGQLPWLDAVRQECIELPVYSLWKQGEIALATLQLLRFKNEILSKSRQAANI